MSDPTGVRCVLAAPDLAASVDFYTRVPGMAGAGATLTQPPADEPWGMREFGIRTPDGHRIRFGQESPGRDGRRCGTGAQGAKSRRSRTVASSSAWRSPTSSSTSWSKSRRFMIPLWACV